MSEFGYAIYDSTGRPLKISSAFRRTIGAEISNELPDRIGEWLESGEGEESRARLLQPGTVWATSRVVGGGPRHRVRLKVERLETQSEEGFLVAEILDVDRGGAARTRDSSTEDLDFLTTVSHELRAPLNGIIGFAALLEASELNDEQSEVLRKLQSSNFMLKGLINDILEYSRIRSSKVDLAEEAVDLTEFMDELIGLFSERARAKGLGLLADVDSKAKGIVSIPKLRVAQILTNLLSNAIKFTEEGEVGLHCSVEETSSGKRIVFKVEDTGPGVDEKDLPRIFEPFSQIEEQGRSSVESTGLGLAISRGLATAMGGSLRYQKRCLGGSIFSLEIPLSSERRLAEDRRNREEKAEPPPARRSEPLLPEGTRILVVEDNQLNADIITHFLNDIGTDFDIVGNGREAVEMSRENRYDLILMDVMLPEMNGYEATEAILQDPDIEEKPVVIGVTAKVFRDDSLRCLEVGMAEVLHKPVDFRLLRNVIEKQLLGKEPMEEPPDPERESAAAEAVAPVDRAAASDYARRMSDTVEGQRQALDRAKASLEDLLGQIKAAERSADREALERHAHSLKGNAALVGARDLRDLAKGLEEFAASSGKELRVGHWVTLLDAAIEDFGDWIKRVKSGLGS